MILARQVCDEASAKDERLAENSSGLCFDKMTSRDNKESCGTADIGGPIALFARYGASGRQTQPCLDITCYEVDDKAERKRLPSTSLCFAHIMVQAKCSGRSPLDAVCYGTNDES